ncbi:MAG: ABC transporter ATP-binding protein [Thermodesulfovibrionales bacterium]|nr:ABC transporter ATP-binding protein [Thermodesulfovibrionales bacterium]
MIAIEVINLTKFYRLYNSPVDRLKELILRRPFHTQFKALNEVTFSVESGTTLGIIGENGAGKSTLLKILANTLKPSTGKIKMIGKVSSLLELGAGFNPDLSGQENIYLNAYLMGIKREEINQRKQDIIDFAEIGEFINQPIKTYSSGMQVRLAFSIATSINPDILIVDEALSVGDEYFQKKSMNRMVEFKKQGKTIVFCSHSIYYIKEICDEVIWLHKGTINSKGSAIRVIMDYQNFERNKSAHNSSKKQESLSLTKQVWIDDIRLTDDTGKEKSEFKTFDTMTIFAKVKNQGSPINVHIGFVVKRNDEVECFTTTTRFDGLKPLLIKDSKEIFIKIPNLTLLTGLYKVELVIGDENALFPFDKKDIHFSVISNGKEIGITYLEHKWHL